MPVLPKSAILWMFVLAVIVTAVAGFTGEATAQVYQGPLDFDTLPPFTMTVTLHPSGPASYTLPVGSFTDRGLLVATVSGSAVFGFFQSTVLAVSQCFFQGSYDGTTAILALDPTSCGGGGTLTLARVS